jgi:homoserine O-acetyltransferase/O-succinyltransferase
MRTSISRRVTRRLSSWRHDTPNHLGRVRHNLGLLLGLVAASCVTLSISASELPPAREGDVVLRDLKFASGEMLTELRMHYRVLGQPQRNSEGSITNAVLVLHGTGGSGAQFLAPEFAAELFGPGQPLDVNRYFVILRDAVGHGQSAKPSDGMRASFPRYGYHDMVRADFLMLTQGLGVHHVRLILGTSMGGMHTWLWGQLHPDFADALMPLASLPVQIAGRNRVWRKLVIDAIRGDPAWRAGNYTVQPPSLRTALQMLFFVSSNPVLRQQEGPTASQADTAMDQFIATRAKTADANDLLYAFEASHDYDPSPGLEKIQAPLLAWNSADDLINPPELGILEREIKRVRYGRAIIFPVTDATRGHGSHSVAKLWKNELLALLRDTQTKPNAGR